MFLSYLEGIYGINLCAYHTETGTHWFRYDEQSDCMSILTLSSEGGIVLEKHYVYSEV